PVKGVTDPAGLFTQPYADALTGKAPFPAPFDCFMKNASPLTSPLPVNTKVPALYVIGENDELIDPATNRPAFATPCERGPPLQYLECAGASHAGAEADSHDDMLTFFEERAMGMPLPDGTCAVSAAVTCTSTPAP